MREVTTRIFDKEDAELIKILSHLDEKRGIEAAQVNAIGLF